MYGTDIILFNVFVALSRKTEQSWAWFVSKSYIEQFRVGPEPWKKKHKITYLI